MRDDVKTFWDDMAPEYMRNAYRYGSSPDTRYPFYETRRDRLIEILRGLKKGRCLDAGCGGGQILLPLVDGGWDAHGVDSSPQMIGFAREALKRNGHDEERATVSSVEDLSAFKDNSFDVVFSMGVIEYLNDDQERRIYQETRRVLKTGGVLIVEYINMLFDISTFNRFTVDFFRNNIFPKFFEDKKADELTERMRSLVTYPDKPDRQGKYSTTRDQVYNRIENPLTFPQRAKSLGFEQSDLVFYRFHAVPPLLFENDPDLE